MTETSVETACRRATEIADEARTKWRPNLYGYTADQVWAIAYWTVMGGYGFRPYRVFW